MQLPSPLLESLRDVKGFNEEAFRNVHESGVQVTSVRLNPVKPVQSFPQFGIEQFQSQIPWCETGFYLEKRPSFTFDPLFHAGCYYVQEASSMFLEQAFRQLIDLSQPLKVLDLCGAPGGKSTHIQSLISPDSLLVSNEVIKSRAYVLKENIIKWGHSNAVVTNNDPADFAKLKGYFDVIVVDAPCSGSGLFRRDPEAIEEWSLNNVQLCHQRQQRILADVWPALKENGILVYSTCSYSKEEDEEIVDWMTREMNALSLSLEVNQNWNIVESGGGYRFWPDRLMGEGFFMACFQKLGEEPGTVPRLKYKPASLARTELSVAERWVNKDGLAFIKHDTTVYAWPQILEKEFSVLLNQFRVVYSGTIIGELLRDKLIPDHALAMSKLVSNSVPVSSLDYTNAIQYLKRKDMSVETEVRGWQLVSYEGQLLGWMNVLPNRINNYYPKELRILKDN